MKKRLSWLLTVTLLLNLAFPCFVFAENDKLTFEVGSAQGWPGSTNVEIPIYAKNNPGIASVNLKVTYDESRLEITGATINSSWTGTPQVGDTEKNPFGLSWVDSSKNFKEENSTFATLTFKIKGNAPAGNANISLACEDEDNINCINESAPTEDPTNVAFQLQNGTVTVFGVYAKPASPTVTELAFNAQSQAPVFGNDVDENAMTLTNEQRTDVGNYTSTIALKDKATSKWADNSTDDITYSWSITQAEVSVLWGDTTTFTYSGSPQSPDMTISKLQTDTSGNLPTATVTYVGSGDYNSTTAPTNAGEYTATVSNLTGNSNYKLPTTGLTKAFTITKADQSAPAAPTVSSTSATSITLAALTGGEYSKGGTTWQSSPTFTELTPTTEYTFYQRLAADDNHNVSAASESVKISTTAHTHNWSYEASGATITATCEDDDGGHGEGKTATLTIVAPTLKTYGGTGNANATTTGGIGGVEAPEIKYYQNSTELTEAPTTVGSYKAEITLGSATASVSYTIAETASEVTTPPAPAVGLAYTGEAQALLTSAGVAEGGTMVFSLSENGAYAAEIPTGTDAGKYSVWYKVNPDANHSESDPVKIDVEIAKADNSWSSNPTAKTDLVYSGVAQELIQAGVPAGGTAQYSLDGAEYAATIPTGTTAGPYTVYYKIDGGTNYQDVAAANFVVDIGKADAALTAPQAVSGLKYTGEPQTLITAGTTSDGTMLYSLDNSSYAEAIPTGTNNQEYTVWYKVQGDGNHNDSQPKSVTVTISEADNGWATAPAANADLHYTGAEQQLITAGTPTGGTAQYRLNDGSYTTGIPQAAAAGTYTIYYKIDGGNHYADVAEASFTVTIGKPLLTVTANNKVITYGDAPTNDGVEITGFVNSETVEALSGELAYTYSYNQYGDAGEYTITPSGYTSDNYDFTYVNGTLTVEPKEVGLTWAGMEAVDDFEIAYDGQSHAPTVEVTGAVNGDEIAAVVAGAQTNAGEYTATASALTGGKAGNYKLPTEKTHTFEITKIGLTVSAENTEITYGDAAPTNIALNITGFVNSETETVLDKSGLTFAFNTSADQSGTAYAQGADKGTYYIIPSGLSAANYTLSYGTTGTLTVNQKPVTIEWGATSFTYNGTEQAPAAVVRGVIEADIDNVSATVTGAKTYASDAPYTATVATSGLIGAKATNYSLAEDAMQTFTIAKAPVTITGVRADYDGGVVLSGGTVNGLMTSDGNMIEIKYTTPSITGTGKITLDAETIAANVILGKKVESTEATSVLGSYNLTSINNGGTLTVNIPLANVTVETADTSASANVSEEVQAAIAATNNANVTAAADALKAANSITVTKTENETRSGIDAAAYELASDESSVGTAKKSEALNQLKENANISNEVKEALAEATADAIAIIVKPIIDITIKAITSVNSADSSSAVGSFTVNITPKYELVATTKSVKDAGTALDNTNSMTLGEAAEMTVTEPTKLSIPVPDSFYHANSNHHVYVKHKTYMYIAQVAGTSGSYLATFTNPHGFSDFEISPDPAKPVFIGETDTAYDTLAAAIAAVQNGQTIVIAQADVQPVAVDRAISFKLAYSGAGSLTSALTAASGFTLNVGDGITANSMNTFAATLSLSAPASIPSGIVGTAVSAQITASNGDAPYTYSKTSGPEWLVVNASTGSITGTRPSAAATGIPNLVILVTDAMHNTASATIPVGDVTGKQQDQGQQQQQNTSGGGGGGRSSGSSSNTASATTIGGNGAITVSVGVSGTTATIKAPSATELGKAVKGASATGELIIDVSGLGKTVNTVSLPASTLQAIEKAVSDSSNQANALTFKLTNSAVTFDAKALAAIAKQLKGSNLKLSLDGVAVSSLNTAQQTALKDMDVQAVINTTLTSGDTDIHDFDGGNADVRVPYTLKVGQNANGILVYYVAEDGDKTEVPTNYANGQLIFTASHFSSYIVAYDKTRVVAGRYGSFSDLDADAWYHDGVNYVLENGIMSGVGGNLFAPNNSTSRAMMAQILWNMEGRPAVKHVISYTDVDGEQWYAEAIRWATSEKIMSGYGGGKFGPSDAMTREQLATIVYRYAQYKGLDVSVGENTNILGYSDAFDVSEWAIPAMQWAVGSGTVTGKSASTLNPGDVATRAEIATIVMRYCTEIVK